MTINDISQCFGGVPILLGEFSGLFAARG